jgi:hypothetical protein
MQTSARKSALLRMRKRAESGAGGITFQVVGYIYLLVIMLGLVYDFGGVVFAQTVLNSSIVVASQQMARKIDRSEFLNNQEVRLNRSEISISSAQSEANLVVGSSSTMRGPAVTVTDVQVTSNAYTDSVRVSGRTSVRFPILGFLIGLPPMTLTASAVASPEFGITNTNQ